MVWYLSKFLQIEIFVYFQLKYTVGFKVFLQIDIFSISFVSIFLQKLFAVRCLILR